MRKSNQAKIKHLPIEQFLLVTTGKRGPDPVAPMMLVAAAFICALTVLLTL